MADSSPFQPPVDQSARQRWLNLRGCSDSLALANLAQQQQRPVVLICNDNSSAQNYQRELQFFSTDTEVLQLPDWETLPYDTFSPHQDIISDRLATLYRLQQLQQGLLIVPVSTLMQRLLPRQHLLAHSLVMQRGETLDPHQLRQQLEYSGYRCVNTVYEHGEFALRGAIMDIFPMGSQQPFRIELFDDEIESLRSFNPETQRTDSSVEKLQLLPGKEYPLDSNGISQFRQQWHRQFDVDHRRCPVYQDVTDGLAPAGVEYYLPLFYEHCDSLFDYLGEQAIFASFDGVDRAAEQFWQELHLRYEERNIDPTRPLLAPKQLYLPVDELFQQLKQYPRISITTNQEETRGSIFATEPPPFLNIDHSAEQPFAAVNRQLQAGQQRVLFCAESPGRRQSLLELLQRNGWQPELIDNWQQFANGDSPLALTVAPIDRGLLLPQDQLMLIAESQLFGQQVLQRRRRRRSSDNHDAIIKNLTELRVGAPVVHHEHGIGRYHGLQTLDVGEENTEFLTLEYADGAKLYVPVADLHLISRYSGADESLAPLHRLGSDQWERAKRKAAEKVHDVAAELLDIYARREARPGQSFDIPDQAYAKFSAGFPFEETPDQETAIAAVIEDMRAPRATDRLICGDVGFGKTEVAMRAAFITVHNHRQVAVLVPTTLLAQQHYQSFRDRFADWPVTVEVISRFRSAAEQQQILARVAAGKVDILIGTHKLLQEDVRYHNLGLLIIDEEHRFGVRQKEKLKAMRAEVDILTLTATPIPRTLNMAMSGMRDLSIIATPPARRLSVKTFVRQWDKAAIKEAILREIMRGGQVYYLHNEVKTIDKTAAALQELIPELRIGIGHGQMPEKQLEQVMADFYHKRYNLLLCTTIIETGIDVPSANTIIIDRADKFGLAQLHQLRGRVGRSHHQAYAYLLTPDRKLMTDDAGKRLDAIVEAGELGAGFMLATHDLEIRGAGELLGEDQSGQIQNIGYSLYMEMLDRAVKALREGKTVDLSQRWQPGSEINLRLPALIPDEYLPDVHSRLIMYKRIASAENDEQLRELQVEMIDRFGLLPDPVKNLFRVTAMKLRAQTLGIERIEAGGEQGKLEFAEQTRIDPMTIVQLVQQESGTYQLAGATTLKFKQAMASYEQRFEFLESLLEQLTPETLGQTAA